MPIEEKFINYLHALQQHRRQTYGGHSQVQESDNRGAHEIFQSSTINALLKEVYDGDMTYGQLRKHGDFGLGTFNALDGEMIAFDGMFYQIRSDGVAYPVDDAQKTPFAIVQFFQPDFHEALDREMDYEQLKSFFHSVLPTRNFFYAIRIDGFFKYIETRSVPRQIEPYPPLVEVVKAQPVFEFFDVQGTLAGFRFPDYALGVNVPGYHLHFITEERKAGGHVLDCRIQNGKIAVEHTSNFHMELPKEGAFLNADFTKDQRETIRQVEE
jgi:acetolactate decarboxylase